MGFIIKAINLETKECVLYARKSQRYKVIDGVKYKYFVPEVDLDLRSYTDISHCNMAILFLQEQFKQPFKTERGVEWKDIWSFQIEEMIKPDNEYLY